MGDADKATENLIKCGIIMPITPIDGCSADHWGEVLLILKEALPGHLFNVDLVSNSNEVGIIQKNIVQNIYHNEMVICDVSGKNPNVMFELGMRLAFDKPTVIIKDDKTQYSFDTAPIEHLEYPRDLHYPSIVEFKTTLKNKVIATYEASKKPEYTTFLKHFGEFKVASITEKEVTSEQFIVQQIKDISDNVQNLSNELGLMRRSEGIRSKPLGLGDLRDFLVLILQEYSFITNTKNVSLKNPEATKHYLTKRVIQQFEIPSSLASQLVDSEFMTAVKIFTKKIGADEIEAPVT